MSWLSAAHSPAGSLTPTMRSLCLKPHYQLSQHGPYPCFLLTAQLSLIKPILFPKLCLLSRFPSYQRCPRPSLPASPAALPWGFPALGFAQPEPTHAHWELGFLIWTLALLSPGPPAVFSSHKPLPLHFRPPSLTQGQSWSKKPFGVVDS